METILFDGECNLCRAAAARLEKWVARRPVRFESFREPGVLARFPAVSLERCEQRLQLVTASGRVFEGAAAMAVLLRRRSLGLSLLYFIPVLRQLIDLAYDLVARWRFRIAGRSGCESGACAIKYRPRKTA